MLSSFARMVSHQMRRKDRQIVSKDDLFSIAKSCKFASVGLIDNSESSNIRPYVVPLSFGIKWEKGSDNPLFYFHSAKNGRKIELLKNNPHACMTLVKTANINPYDNTGPNADICSASIIQYESLIVEGQFEMIKNEKEKQEALSIILDHYDQPTDPINLQVLSQTCVFKLTAVGRKTFNISNFYKIFKKCFIYILFSEVLTFLQNFLFASSWTFDIEEGFFQT